MRKYAFSCFIAVFILVSCASSGSITTRGLVITRQDNHQNISTTLFIDGNNHGEIGCGETKTYSLGNGKHIFYVNSFNNAAGIPLSKNRSDCIQSFTLDDDTYYYNIAVQQTDREFEVVVEEPRIETNTPSESEAHSIEIACNKVSTKLISELPSDKIIAVLNIASNSVEISAFAIEQIEYQLVCSNKYKMVDREYLNEIRKEQHFQLSGEVNDKTAVKVGKFLGANIVITGALTGTGTLARLTIKALDVETGQILSMPREAL
jgi:hypothetical protein